MEFCVNELTFALNKEDNRFYLDEKKVKAPAKFIVKALTISEKAAIYELYSLSISKFLLRYLYGKVTPYLVYDNLNNLVVVRFELAKYPFDLFLEQDYTLALGYDIDYVRDGALLKEVKKTCIY